MLKTTRPFCRMSAVRIAFFTSCGVFQIESSASLCQDCSGSSESGCRAQNSLSLLCETTRIVHYTPLPLWAQWVVSGYSEGWCAMTATIAIIAPSNESGNIREGEDHARFVWS